MVSVEIETSCWVGLPLIICFLLRVDTDLNLIDLVLTGLDRPGAECRLSLGGCFRVYFKICFSDNLTILTSNSRKSTIGFLTFLTLLALGPVAFILVEVTGSFVVPIIPVVDCISFSTLSNWASLPAAAVA